MITCREYADFIRAYLDGEMSEDEVSAFDAHMAVCPSCVDYLESYRVTVDLARCAKDPDGPIPDEVPEDLVRAILDARQRK